MKRSKFPGFWAWLRPASVGSLSKPKTGKLPIPWLKLRSSHMLGKLTLLVSVLTSLPLRMSCRISKGRNRYFPPAEFWRSQLRSLTTPDGPQLMAHSHLLAVRSSHVGERDYRPKCKIIIFNPSYANDAHDRRCKKITVCTQLKPTQNVSSSEFYLWRTQNAPRRRDSSPEFSIFIGCKDTWRSRFYHVECCNLLQDLLPVTGHS